MRKLWLIIIQMPVPRSIEATLAAHSLATPLKATLCSYFFPVICHLSVHIYLSPPLSSQHKHHNSNDTALGTQSLTETIDSLRYVFEFFVSLHTVGRDSSLIIERDIVEVHLILNCNVIFLTFEKSLLSYV